jgi:acetoacetate decarboxylase
LVSAQEVHSPRRIEPLAEAMANRACGGTPRICELVRYYMKDVTLKGA